MRVVSVYIKFLHNVMQSHFFLLAAVVLYQAGCEAACMVRVCSWVMHVHGEVQYEFYSTLVCWSCTPWSCLGLYPLA